MSGQLTADRAETHFTEFDPGPILAAADDYRGSIVDLDRSHTIDPSAFARGWRDLADDMAACGLRSGDRLVMAIGNGPLFPAALAAALSQGGSPLLVHAETPLAELKRTALKVGASYLLCDALDGPPLQAAGFDVKAIGETAWTQALWASTDRQDPAFQEPQWTMPGVPLHPTSGSTGEPKVAARPGYCAKEEARHYVETIGIDRHDVLLAVPPMSHAYAYGMCVMVPLLTGASLVTMRRFRPDLVHRAMQAHNITVFPAVPMMIDMLLAGGGEPPPPAQCCVLSAGAPLAERTAREFQRRWRRPVRPLYGSTETGGIAVGSGAEAATAGCVGPPMDGVSVDIRPLARLSHHGQGLGKVCVRSSSMMAGYIGRDGLDASPIADGWFATGDLGRLDSSGVLHLTGRDIDVINVCGMKVVASEVEEIIAALPGVKEVKVYPGRRDGSQFVKAAVVAPGFDAAQVYAYCEEHLVYYKRPETIALVAALPRSPSGKILRDQLP